MIHSKLPFRDRRGEGSLDTALTVLIVCFLLSLTVSLMSLAVRASDLHRIALELAESAALQGHTDVEERAAGLREQYGLNFTYSFEGSVYLQGQRVQLGDPILCSVTLVDSMSGFGETLFRIPLQGQARSSSRVYWK